MRSIFRIGAFLCTLSLITIAFADHDKFCKGNDEFSSILMPRSPHSDLVQSAHRLGYQFSNNCFYGHFRVGYKFQESFHGKRMAESLFGLQSPTTNKHDDNDATLTFSGSGITNRNATDLLADYFGLATETSNLKISFRPRIVNHTVNFNLQVGLSELLEGLYFQLDFPLVYHKWQLRDSYGYASGKEIKNAPTLSTTKFFPGYMDNVGSITVTTGDTPVYTPTYTRPSPVTSLDDALSTIKFGTQKDALQYGKFFGNVDHDTKLAAVVFDLGYNFYDCPDYHVGAYFHLAAPTGTKIDDAHAQYLFSPTVGYDHWQVGAGLTAHAELYNCDCDHILTAYAQGYIAHLCERKQVRSFDILNAGHLSRYMLLKEIEPRTNAATGKIITAIDYSTRQSKVSVDVLGEALLELVYKNACGFSVGGGYNIFGKTAEEVKILENVSHPKDSSLWAIKGTTNMADSGFGLTLSGTDQNFAGTIGTNNSVPRTVHSYLSASQDNATIFAGGTTDNALALYVPANDTTDGFVYLDNWQRVTTDPLLPDPQAGDTYLPTPAGSVYNVSYESAKGTLAMNADNSNLDFTTLTLAPVVLDINRLDRASAEAPSQVTHKLFAHAGYEWVDCDWTPFVRAGAEVEFAAHDDKGAMSAWGIFFTGGLSF